MAKIDIYETVTNTIIEALEKGIDNKNWEMPWHGSSAMPQNAHTGNIYRGVNVPLLWAWQAKKEYSSAIWGTYRQWAELGAQVKKGEKGIRIVFWKSIKIEPQDENEEEETRMFAKYSTVFNADQVDGYEIKEDAEIEKSDIQAIACADSLIDASGAIIQHEENRAFYSPTLDYINVPTPEYFKDTKAKNATENYFSVIFHELSHWTGHKSRLDRKPNGDSSRAEYAYEELVAELGAAMCCASAGVSSVVRDDHAQYIGGWLKALKNDKKFIFSASSQAQKAVDYLYSLENTE